MNNMTIKLCFSVKFYFYMMINLGKLLCFRLIVLFNVFSQVVKKYFFR